MENGAAKAPGATHKATVSRTLRTELSWTGKSRSINIVNPDRR